MQQANQVGCSSPAGQVPVAVQADLASSGDCSRGAEQEPLTPACQVVDQHAVCTLSSGGQPCTVPVVSTCVPSLRMVMQQPFQGQLAAHVAAQQAKVARKG